MGFGAITYQDERLPLTAQTIAILEELNEYSGHQALIFPGAREPKPISENTIRKILHRQGFQVSGHGFRKTASTTLHELGYHTDAIERQLAHAPRNQIRGIYNKAEYIDYRSEMMRDWSDMLTAIEKEQAGEVYNRFKQPSSLT